MLAACGGDGRTPAGAPTAGDPPDAPQASPTATTTRIGGTPVAVAVGGDAVWVLDQSRGTLASFDAASGRRSGPPVRVGRSPLAMAVGEGAVWVLDAAEGVRRVDLETGRPAGGPIPVEAPTGIAAGAGGVWVSSRGGQTVTRIDPAAQRADQPIDVGGGPADIAVSGSSVWVAQADAGTVRRIDAGTAELADPLRVGTGQVLALAADDRTVWAAASRTRLNDDIELVRIDAGTARLKGEPSPLTGGVPLELAAGEGHVWVTDVGADLPGSPSRTPALLRIPGGGGAATTAARIPGRPSSVAVGDGAVWVTDSSRGTLTKLTLG